MAREFRMATGYICPICERGRLILVAPQVWQCERQRCNNEFFHDADGTLNVRDKPSLLTEAQQTIVSNLNWAGNAFAIATGIMLFGAAVIFILSRLGLMP